MMLQKTFVKDPGKLQVTLCLGYYLKKSMHPINIYCISIYIYIYYIIFETSENTHQRRKQQLKEVSIAPAISAQRLLKFSHCTCRVHIGQDRETWLFVISHRESWWGELLEWASNIS